MFESASFCNGQKKCLRALFPVTDNERFERASSFNGQRERFEGASSCNGQKYSRGIVPLTYKVRCGKASSFCARK